jgi:transposase-like protein
MIVRIGGKRMFMWRAVEKEGEVVDINNLLLIRITITARRCCE